MSEEKGPAVNPTQDDVSDEANTWEDLARSQTIRIDSILEWGSNPLTKGHALLRSIEVDISLPDDLSTPLFLCMKHYPQCSIYKPVTRNIKSRWVGMHSYYAGKAIQNIDPESEDSSSWLLYLISKHPSIVHTAGIFLVYCVLPTQLMRIDFHLRSDRILRTVLDFGRGFIYPSRNQQLLLKTIIRGKKGAMIEEDADMLSERRRQADINFENFFAACNKLKEKANVRVPNYRLNVDNLNFRLMPYQADTVQWMIYREDSKTTDECLNWNYQSQIISSNHLYYPYLGVVTQRPLDEDEEKELTRRNTLKGGILADEMGLGKTVQVLSLISSHRRGEALVCEERSDSDGEYPIAVQLPNYSIAEQVRIAETSFTEMKSAKKTTNSFRYDADSAFKGDTITCPRCEKICSATACGWDFETRKNEEFLCPSCITKIGIRTDIKTTLVIVPESLIFQWFTEIAKHCSDKFRVMFYFGVGKHGYLQPREMQKYDIILTTYDTIRSEVTFSDAREKPRRLRREIKSLYVVSPLVHVNFWRVVVDESQVLPQTITSNIATMLSHIKGINWWCVTGTPLVKTVGDILPLLTFLKYTPFGNPKYFFGHLHPQYLDLFARVPEDQEMVENLTENVILTQLLSTIMSRKTKVDVEKQLGLPELVEIEKKICFTAVEERLYKEEKDRLKETVGRAIKRSADSAWLADLHCRDKVLQELRVLRETVLTGLTVSHNFGRVGFVYAPESVIFRLVYNKRVTLLCNLRDCLMYALGLAGVQMLMNKPENAVEIYTHILNKYHEIIASIGMETVKGREQFYTPNTQVEELEVVRHEFHNESDRDVMTEDSLDKRQQMNRAVRTIQSICDEYRKKSRNSTNFEKGVANETRESEEVDANLPGPSEANRPSIDQDETATLEKQTNQTDETASEMPRVDDETIVEGEDILEEKEEQRKIKILAIAAMKPLKMDTYQEVHLIINLYKSQVYSGLPETEYTPLSRLYEVSERYMKMEKQSFDSVNEGFLFFNSMWENDEHNLISGIEEFFEQMYVRSATIKETTALYDKRVIQYNVRRDHLPNLPYVALYDPEANQSKKSKKSQKDKRTLHNTLRCMGRCDVEWNCNPYETFPFLSVINVLKKTLAQIILINAKRKEVETQMNSFIELMTKMVDPVFLIDYLSRNPENITEEQEKANYVILCKHDLYNGTNSQREDVDKYYDEEHVCALCDMWCKISSLAFTAGIASYHGEMRNKSSVLGFATYLVDHYTLGRHKATEFLRTHLRPLFELINDTVKVLRDSILVIVEMLDRVKELKQATTLLTSEQVIKFFAFKDLDDPMESKYEAYEAQHLGNRDEKLQETEKDAGELRYLVHLMEKQLTGGKESDECPVCKCGMESFMVFTCGHRVCTECFERLKAVSRETKYDASSSHSITCPSCRVKNNPTQVMMARDGHSEEESIIPGVVLSSKLRSAILLIRNILEKDSSNKVILFTSFEPSTSVWDYLLRILNLAKLPFSSTTRANCGKKIIDFEVSPNIKVLLCSLSLCANGLNMTGANHIIFLDPPHLQSVLHQAIGRINRFGQRRAMRVYHLVVEGSIDSELRQIAKNNRAEDEKKGWTVGDIRSMFDC